MLLDVHTHIQFAAYDIDREAVIKRALDAGVWMVNVGTQRDTSKAAVALADKYEKGIYAAVGLHPIHLEKSYYHDQKELGGGAAARAFTGRGEEFDYEYYKNLAKHPKVVAIGECGLDYYRLATSDMGQATRIKERQKEAFLEQAKLAQELNKTLMIHCRPSYAKASEGKASRGTNDAYEDLLSLIPNSQFLIPKVVHFYVGGLDITKKLVKAGFYFTFGGVITFTRDYDDSIKYIPLDRILLETDAPYVAPAPYRGKRNEPAYIVETAKKIAEIKNISFHEFTQKIAANALQVFKIHL